MSGRNREWLIRVEAYLPLLFFYERIVQMEPKKLIGRHSKDPVTGFSGEITGYWISKTGSDRVLLEGIDTTGRPIDFWADLERIELI